jgi:hypothetical protein
MNHPTQFIVAQAYPLVLDPSSKYSTMTMLIMCPAGKLYNIVIRVADGAGDDGDATTSAYVGRNSIRVGS